jgi:hypothetical protein
VELRHVAVVCDGRALRFIYGELPQPPAHYTCTVCTRRGSIKGRIVCYCKDKDDDGTLRSDKTVRKLSFLFYLVLFLFYFILFLFYFILFSFVIKPKTSRKGKRTKSGITETPIFSPNLTMPWTYCVAKPMIRFTRVERAWLGDILRDHSPPRGIMIYILREVE